MSGDSYTAWKKESVHFVFVNCFHFLQLHDDFSLWYGLKERIGQYIMFLNIVFTFCNYMMTTVFGYLRTAWEKSQYIMFFFPYCFHLLQLHDDSSFWLFTTSERKSQYIMSCALFSPSAVV